MHRITIWLTATLAVVAMATYYQLSLSGDGKAGEGGGAQTEQTGEPGEQK